VGKAPRAHHSRRAADGGHAEPVIGRAFARPGGFAHPTDCTAVIAGVANQSTSPHKDGLLRRVAPRNDDVALSVRQSNATGKSTKPVHPFAQKYFA